MANKNNKKASKNKNSLWWIVAIGVIIIAGLAIVIGLGGRDQTGSLALEVSVDQAHQMRSDGAFMLDVREPDEWNSGHIPGATLIPLGQLPDRVNELPVDQKIVVVCRSGNRSATGRDILLNAGFDQVTSMAGGMNQWAAKGYEIVTGP
jgi:rhodanese-related sulfurtransferase